MEGKTGKGKLQRASGPKRAGIYIRVSSEEQAVRKNSKTQEDEERFSPKKQEQDCQEYCEQRGYIVVAIYRDVEKYRAGGRLVEPSATRADRPGLLSLLADVDAGKLDVIVGWREDRLYRGVNRALLEISERVKAGKVDVELVKEKYDASTAAVKAWAAGVELDAKHDRLMMGVAGRLAKGLAWNGPPPYGYNRVDGKFEINPDESRWLVKMWRWCAAGAALKEIRRRLIKAGARPRFAVKRPWQIGTIRKFLKAEYYYTGVQRIVWDSEVYEIKTPTLIDAETARRVREHFERFKKYPAGNMKAHALAAGLTYCKACNSRMSVVSKFGHRVMQNGKRVRYPHYLCAMFYQDVPSNGCAQTVSAAKLDQQIWEKVWSLVSEPGKFERAIERRIQELQAKEMDAKAECDRLEKQLESLEQERQRIITLARKGLITEADLDQQLAVWRIEQDGTEREWNEKRLLIGNRLERLRELARIYREEVTAGATDINDKPETPAHEQLQFEARRKIVQRLVTRVDVCPDKTPTVHTEIDLLNGQISSPLTI